jgi:two-component system, cell cycle sensor histidine kinase and response regulator CckA
MSRILSLSIRTHLLLMALIVAFPAAGSMVYSSIKFRQQAIDDAIAASRKLGDSIANEQNQSAASSEQLMSALAQLPVVKSHNAAGAQQIFSDILKLNPQYLNISVTDRAGMVWASAIGTEPVSMSDRRYFKNAMATGRLSSGEYIVSRVASSPTINLCYPFKKSNGEIYGTMIVAFRLDRFSQIIDTTQIKGYSYVFFDHNGIVLNRSTNPGKSIGQRDNPRLFSLMQGLSSSGTFIGLGTDGKKRFIAYRKLYLKGEQSPYMYIRSGIPFDTVVAKANGILFYNLALFVSGLALALFFAWLVGKRSIVDRISRLQGASRSLSQGDLQVRVSGPAGGELGDLGRAFNEMAGNLEAREKERAGAEAALRKSEQQFQLMFRTHSAVMLLVDPENGAIVDANLSAERFYGYSHETLLGMNIEQINTLSRDEILLALRSVKDGSCSYFKFQHKVASGALLSIEAHSSPIAMWGTHLNFSIIHDITARERAEEERQEHLHFIRELLGNAPVGIRVFDGDSGDCLLANQASADIAGGDIESLRSQNFRDLASWRASGLLHFAEAVLADGRTRMMEIDMTTSFSKAASISYIISRFVVKDKANLLVIGRDIFVEKQLVDKNRKIEEQMLHVQKLESLGVLAGGIAHDFNNILLAILGNAELAMMHLTAGSPLNHYLQQIEKAAQRAADLARQMLAYSGKGQFVTGALHINALITEMSNILEVSISKMASIRLNLAENLPSFEGDATQIRQIIMNLVINASEAVGSESGVITVTTSVLDCDHIFLSGIWMYDQLEPGSYLCFEVADTGCGMDSDTLAKLFDPFFTTKFTGRGLGMAAVLGIVRGHHGAITVDSSKGQGSRFKVFLPAILNGTDACAPELTSSPLSMGSGCILLVDDEEMILNLGKNMLEQLGYSVITAGDGIAALELFQRHQDEIVCVILDLTMPLLDGEQTYRELRRRDPQVHVIMSSGFNEQEVARKFAGKEPAGFLQKPYKFEELSRKLSDVLGVR